MVLCVTSLSRKEHHVRVLVFDPSRCTGCHICEETCSQTWFKVVDRGLSCIQILDGAAAPSGEGPYQAITCTQCGECIDVCPTQALHRAKNGVVRRNLSLCVGCLACVGFCPVAGEYGGNAGFGAAAMRAHPAHVEPFKCVACGACARACPEEALQVVEVEDAPLTATERWAQRERG
jgi:Fe-S-cluster-containing dehydrogenase component